MLFTLLHVGASPCSGPSRPSPTTTGSTATSHSGVTFVFGFATIVMTTYLWSLMGADITANVQSVLIYTITGAHILMVVIAMIFVALMAFRALAGGFTARQHDGITAAALFWYATVAVYVLIWITIYVTK